MYISRSWHLDTLNEGRVSQAGEIGATGESVTFHTCASLTHSRRMRVSELRGWGEKMNLQLRRQNERRPREEVQ